MRLILWLGTFTIALWGASSPFDVTVEGAFRDTLYDLTEDYDGQLAAVGFSEHFETETPQDETYTNAFDYLERHNRTYGEQIRLIRLDRAGSVTLDRSFSLDAFNRAVSVLKTPDNGYFVGGYTHEGEMLLAKLDANGKSRFLERFGTATSDRLERLVGLRDGGVLAIGSSLTTRDPADPLFEQGLGKSDISVTRFSKQGTKLWGKKLGTLDDDYGVAAAEAADGSLMILGRHDAEALPSALIFRLDEHGDRIWVRDYTAEGGCGAYDILAMDDGTVAVSLGIRPGPNERVRILGLDLQQRQRFEHDIDSSRGNAVLRLAQRSDGSLVGVGRSIDPESGQTDALALRLAPGGTLLWQRRYGGAGRDLFRSVRVLRDGGIAAAGERVQPGLELPDMWVVKLYEDGSPSFKTAQQPPLPAAHQPLPGAVSPFETATARQTKTAASASPFENAPAAFETPSTGDDRPFHTAGNAAAEQTRSGLYDRLREAFSKEIGNGELAVDRNLRIVIEHPILRFAPGVYELTPPQQEFLKAFSTRLFVLLEPFGGSIEALRINGHTSSEWRGVGETQRYLNNAQLSSRRAMSVLSYVYALPDNRPYRSWLSDVVSHDGYSYAKIVKDPDEDRIASRRVAFEIVLK